MVTLEPTGMKMLIDWLRVRKESGEYVLKGKHYFDTPHTWYSDYDKYLKVTKIDRDPNRFMATITLEEVRPTT